MEQDISKATNSIERLKELIMVPNAKRKLMDNQTEVVHIIPEMEPCIGFQQNSPYHIYDVWGHIATAVDEAAGDYLVRMALLFHDIGKPQCYQVDENGIGHFHGHGHISAEIGTFEALKKVVGHESTLLRPPGGIYEKNLLNLTDKPIVLWTIDTMDWSHQNKDITIKRVLDNVEDGDIVLMHDLFPATADAVEVLVPELTKRGFQLVTVSELLASHDEPDGVVLRQKA